MQALETVSGPLIWREKIKKPLGVLQCSSIYSWFLACCLHAFDMASCRDTLNMSEPSMTKHIPENALVLIYTLPKVKT